MNKFKFIKITKAMFSSPQRLLVEAGACSNRVGYPHHVYMSVKDYKKLTKNTLEACRREMKGWSKDRIATAAYMEMLQYAPVTVKRGIEEGYIMVDEVSLKQEIAKDELNTRRPRY